MFGQRVSKPSKKEPETSDSHKKEVKVVSWHKEVEEANYLEGLVVPWSQSVNINISLASL